MLTVVAALAVLLAPVLALVTLMIAIEARQRAHAAIAARQVLLTDAIHAELGPIVSPVVEKRAFGGWRVVLAVPARRARDVGRLIAITERVLGDQIADVHIVVRRAAPFAAPLAA
jgi:hypothetical protein